MNVLMIIMNRLMSMNVIQPIWRKSIKGNNKHHHRHNKKKSLNEQCYGLKKIKSGLACSKLLSNIRAT